MHITINPGHLTLNDIHHLIQPDTKIDIDKLCFDGINHAANTIDHIVNNGEVVYGINTGFGALAKQKINLADLEDLQRRIVLSHATGTGEYLDNSIVRLMLALKINSLARGFSGIKLKTLELLIHLFNRQIYPRIPAKGSVGASGDLAPLAHLSLTLLGVGEVEYQGKIIAADKALAQAGVKPITLAAKEGLALLNGTQASTAIALSALLKTENLFISALASGAMSVDAALGSVVPFDERIHLLRGHKEQIHVAAMYRALLADSNIIASHQDCEKVQDPYSLRCQPQVMGACLTQFNHIKNVLITEANGVTDNPLVFADQSEILSGGNFHAEPVAFAADNLALAIAEIGALSERRTALLVDPHFSGLNAFLVNEPGLNSGFMMAQVTSAALASENKLLAHPASVDSLPTSANQEDHVSMATGAAYRLHTMVDNTTGILAIELLAACQGIDMRRPLTTSTKLESIHRMVRQNVKFYAEDRFFAPDIEKAKNMLIQQEIKRITEISLI